MIGRSDPPSTQPSKAKKSPGNGGNTSAPPSGQSSEKPSSSFQISAPAISIPKGGGAIRGIGEKFNVNAATGTGSFTVPIATSPGRSGFGPELSLSYNSGAGNGPFGLGWSLSVPAITRKTDKGLPQYRDEEDSDIFLLSGAEDLVPKLILQPDNTTWQRERLPPREEDGEIFTIDRYRPRIEGLLARIERWTHQRTGDVHWRSTSKENIHSIYGRTENSCIADPEDPSRIFSWLLDETSDAKGNLIRYQYKAEDLLNVDPTHPQERNRIREPISFANRYLKRIFYGNEVMFRPENWFFEIVFDYREHDVNEPRPSDDPANSNSQPWPARQDPFSTYRAGFEIRTYRLCRRVLMFHHIPELSNQPYLVRSTDLEYDENPILSRLISITHAGYVRQSDTAPYRRKAMPPVEFTYSRAELHQEIQEMDPESLENLPAGLGGSGYQFVDLNGEGISGILSEQGGAWFYKSGLGNTIFPPNGQNAHPPVPPAMAELGTARFGAKQVVAAQPGTATLLQTGSQLLDLAGDGKLDVVQFSDPVPGFYERTAQGDWESFRAFQDVPNVAWQDPNLKFIDLTGDGHADILVTEQEVFTWYPSQGEEGFGPSQTVRKVLEEERGPAIVLADRTQTVFLADMSGDGLNDIVRIRNGEIAYWPNMGYGRFGAKINMDQAPVFDHPELFDPQRIQLADIDGSGTTDLIYLGRETVTIWANQAGNSWGAPQTLDQLPPVDSLSDISVADILGNGTACLVWSSPLPGDAHQPVRYIDLMGSSVLDPATGNPETGTGKPHLLISIRNNLGAETRLQYAPSTRHYLEDRANGRPWLTKLPFPVHVVERVEIYDWIQQTKFVSLYRYHHGFFDGVEREFHGFAMVEQWDSEEFPPFRGRGLFPEEPANAEEEALHQPPVYTKTWFHTGAYLEGPSLARQLTAEYWREDPHFDLPAEGPVPPDTPPFLADTVLPAGLTSEETRQAVRALKGQLVRQEVYGVDDTPASAHPYTVSEHNYELKLLQPMMGNPYAVFYSHPREALAFQYERQPEDPRVTHQITLGVDEHCNITDSVAIGYPRRNPAFDEQGALQITYTKTDFINRHDEVNFYFIGIPFQTRTYEIMGIPWAWTETPFRWLDHAAFAEVTADPNDFLPYEQPPPAGAAGLQKRLIEWSRSYFRQDEEPELLDPPGDLTHRLPLGVINNALALPYETYTAAFTDAQIVQVFEGRVTEAMLSSVNEGAYHREPDQADYWWIPSGKQAFDGAHFFVPTNIQDPFGNRISVDYDAHFLMPIRIEDPVGNLVQATLEYRVLQPREVIDPNQNHTRAVFDALGMVVGTAVMGKITGNVGEAGDALDGFLADLEESTIREFTTDTDAPAQLAPTLLGTATTRLIYDLDRYLGSRQVNEDGTETGQPVVVATIARETHVNALPPGEESRLQLNFLYSDGLGREIQTKVQAEPGPLDLDDPSAPILDRRWVGTGRTVYNNKGNPIKQYEPFFSDTHHMETEAALVERGVTPVLRYDPLSRLIRTDLPDGSFTLVIFDSWRQETWDQNDTVLESQWYTDRGAPDPAATQSPSDPEQRAAFLAAQHAQTPAIAHLDTLGRTFLTIGDNGDQGQVPTHVTLDIEGNPLVITDARDNQVEINVFDIAGRNVRKHSMDSGTRWTLTDVAGNPIRLWDSRNQQFRFVYDALRRPTHRFVQTDSSGAELLLERIVYGEMHQNPEALNLRGQVYFHADGAGLLTNQRFDFKGNLEEKTRRLAEGFQARVNWTPLAELTDLAQIENTALSQTEDEEFSHYIAYDALNRPTSLITPDASETQPTYNEANLLETMAVRLPRAQDQTFFINNVEYNARGQRILIEYDNGVTTIYTYDDFTFRLLRLQTTRLSDNQVLQDLHYTYDPIGNITEIQDDAQEPMVFDNQEVLPRSRYEYDALYQLVLAEGREHIGQNPNEPRDHRENLPVQTPDPTDVQAMRNYTEHYVYDAVGNIERMQHVAGNGSWTLPYTYASDSNRLLATTSPAFDHDAHGNMTRMPHLRDIAYDFDDQMQRCDLQGGGQVFFTYDAAGQRVRKVHEHNGSTVDERIYLGGYEIFRRRVNGTQRTERQTLHVMDNTKRIALVETLTRNEGAAITDPFSRQRFQFTNHLESAMLELDADGQEITYEEYHPYGTTSYHAVRSDIEVSPKRYRYTGKERDEETGLYYHGARYYAPWLGRWTAADPIGLRDGINLYAYVSGNPINTKDASGRKGTSSKISALEERQAELNQLKQQAPDSPGLDQELMDLEQAIAEERNLQKELTGDEQLHDADESFNEDINVTDEESTAEDLTFAEDPAYAASIKAERDSPGIVERLIQLKKDFERNTQENIERGRQGGTPIPGHPFTNVVNDQFIKLAPEAQQKVGAALGLGGKVPLAKGRVVRTNLGNVEITRRTVKGRPGLVREIKVAEQTGGRLAVMGKKNLRDLKVSATVNGKKVSSSIDVLGPHGELILVGGNFKSVARLKSELTRAKTVATAKGTVAQQAFPPNTRQELIDAATQVVGERNVFFFWE